MSISVRVGVILALIGAVLMLFSTLETANATRVDVGASQRYTEGAEIFGTEGEDLLHGGAGEDDLFGAGGTDEIVGGSGDDFVEAADGETDRVRCGSGDDLVNADESDEISEDCETVYRS